jgi:hypothetical protein
MKGSAYPIKIVLEYENQYGDIRIGYEAIVNTRGQLAERMKYIKNIYVLENYNYKIYFVCNSKVNSLIYRNLK